MQNSNNCLQESQKPTQANSTIIYDIGANNGDDIPYYLNKGDTVIAIEANTSLCAQIARRFPDEIQSKRLIIENVVLTTSSLFQNQKEKNVTFWLHKIDHVLSQFPTPPEHIIHNYEKVSLPSCSIIDLIKKYGDPHYIKIDVEHFDQAILRDLFENDIMPEFISAESHSIDIFSLLITLGKYEFFKLVDGPSVSKKYKNHKILTKNGKEKFFSFPFHSAGPFGDDIAGGWFHKDIFFKCLALSGLGWKDIHASKRLPMPDSKIAGSSEIFPIIARHLAIAILTKVKHLIKLAAAKIIKPFASHKSQ